MVEGKVVGVVDAADIADDVVADGADHTVDARFKEVLAVKSLKRVVAERGAEAEVADVVIRTLFM